MKKKNTEEYGMKKKLTAAVAMLLVATIMMVSTTYAWFTLSTAPEVKNITTTVGANGNLEIALSPLSGEADSIGSSVGDSNKELKERNITWGNLVDLKDSYYGLDKITLMPAALNLDEEGKVVGEIILQTPEYGADGRVTVVKPNTITGVYDAEKMLFPQVTELRKKGVRAIGVASAMSERELTYRNSLNAMSRAASAAKSEVTTSLNNRGGTLASAAIVRAINDDGTYNYRTGGSDGKTDYVAVVGEVIGDLGVVQTKIEAALVAGFKAYAASNAGSADLFKEVNPLETLEAITEKITNPPEKLSDAVTAFEALKASISDAKTAYEGIPEDGEVKWGQLRPALEKIMDPAKITVNGYSTDEVMENLNDFASKVMNEGVSVVIGPEGGIYADIAKICGDYTANGVKVPVKYGSLSLDSMPASLSTSSIGNDEYQVNPEYTEQISAYVKNEAGAPTDDTSSDEKNVDDTYGYMLDFFFRTNAADSNLLLQTDAANRIYADSENEELMGSGSTMTFTAPTEAFADNGMVKLMDALRLVFVDASNNVLSYAKLDMAEGNYDKAGKSITARLYLADRVVDEETKAETWPLKTGTNAAVITSLTQNTATAVSVIVYLDGNQVDNGSVLAEYLTSMTGSLNLQFASSAKLEPMVDTGLMGVVTMPTSGETPETSAPSEETP